MKERPILFNGPMVRAILDSSKTQTRRVVKLPHSNPLGVWEPTRFGGPTGGLTAAGDIVPEQGAIWHTRTGDCLACPIAQPTDRLWVRETHEVNRIGFEESWTSGRTYHAGVKYQADDGRADFEITEGLYQDLSDTESRGWTPSIHMPRWASRITLKVTGVRVERLQAISDADAESEGIDFLRHVPDADETLTPSQLFMCLWDSLAAPGTDWDANPWVWVVEFKRVSEAA